jgi:integrase
MQGVLMIDSGRDYAAEGNRKEVQMPWRKYPSIEGMYGPIYKLSKGIKVRRDWRRQWIIDINVKGERRNRSIGEGREGLVKAIKAAEAIVKRMGSVAPKAPAQQPAEPMKPAFIACATEWYQDNQNRWSPETVTRYEEILRLHVEPLDIYKQPIDRVTRNQVKQHLRALSKNRSPALVEAVHAVVSSIFEEAIDSGLTRDNPARRLLKKILPKKHQRNLKEAAALTVPERDRLMAAAQNICSPSMRLALMVMAFMGLRLGEALAMRLRHLDFNRMLYHVTESYKTGVFRKPKGGKSRLVDIPAFFVADLEAHVAYLRKERLKFGIGGPVDALIVDPEDGHTPFSQRDVQCELRRACKAAGLEIRNPHDLRHTYATILLMAGVSPAYVQKQLGHSSISMTVDIYGHWIPGEGRAGLEAALTGGSGDTFLQKPVRKLRIIAYKNERASVTN